MTSRGVTINRYNCRSYKGQGRTNTAGPAKVCARNISCTQARREHMKGKKSHVCPTSPVLLPMTFKRDTYMTVLCRAEGENSTQSCADDTKQKGGVGYQNKSSVAPETKEIV